mgnify:CR=1 FL=1
MEEDGGQLVELVRRAEELGVRELVGVQRGLARVLVDGGDNLEVVLEEARPVAEPLLAAVQRVDLAEGGPFRLMIDSRCRRGLA